MPTNKSIGRDSLNLLIAEDDMDDQMLTREAFTETEIGNHIHFVKDGEELLHYLFKEGVYKLKDIELPNLIILDLNMPRKTGLEALEEIKHHDRLRNIPVVIFSTSSKKGDINQSYTLGANTYITKPKSYEGFVDIAKSIERYWFQMASLPI